MYCKNSSCSKQGPGLTLHPQTHAPLVLTGMSSSGHGRGIQNFHHLLQKAGVCLPLDFLPGGNMGKKNRFVKVTQTSEWNKPTELSKLQSVLKLPKCPGYKLQQLKEGQSCSQGRQLCYTTFSVPFAGALPLQCLLIACCKKLIGKNLQVKSQFSQKVHPTPQWVVPCNSLLESWMNIF